MSFPSEWVEILDKVRSAGGDDAVIAGGAVRDFLLGRDIKDVDVFLRSQGSDDAFIARAAFPTATKMHCPDDYAIQMPELVSVWCVPAGPNHDIFVDEDRPVQLIFLNGPRVLLPYALDRFDFGLCRAGFDGVRIHYTDAFVHDAFGMTMTLLNEANPEQSLRRYTRLSAKYPHHRLVRTNR